MKTIGFILGFAVLPLGVATSTYAADVELWRLDCGTIEVRDLSVFSDAGLYRGEQRTLTDSCYVIRHGKTYMLWDSGLPKSLIGAKPPAEGPFTPSLTQDIASQLARINLKPGDISLLGISHNHFDHVGQAVDFASAELLINAKDFDAFKLDPAPMAVDARLVEPWIKGKSKVHFVDMDYDVFGDGSVVILKAPGHTEGETALLVNLGKTGPVILSGDVVHFREQVTNDAVPMFNANRAESLASMDRLNDLAHTLKARLVIQHEPEHVKLLPAFPASAR